MPRTVAIIQARVGSRRLPGKVLAPIGGRSMLERVVERVLSATRLDGAVVATSEDPRDDAVEAICRRRGFACFRGSESDVLSRYVGAATLHEADPIVRITADCPLIDPEVIDRVVDAFRGTGLPCDYASNINPPTFPHGLDTEILSAETLRRADREARWQSEREHVTLYVRNHPERFRSVNVTHAPDLSGRRWVVDEATDLEFVRAVYERMGDRPFGMADVLALLQREPELASLNAGIVRDEGLKKSLAEDQLVRP
jgi:spore coat polysaccharide biosynthesis protein SpsF (cytidylyltransferase family)